ncbi:geranylgeranylglyceryl/heptaprenylglyceryl phosphate synthase [Flavobacterium magnum]|uniref:Geranylgeranylglyceryl phosphate synthase n=1 Tax=Flavobacterium magnum TaxID=2162713 RepID=A0A2S0RBY6_9FLAO|nr:geranylgeranylglyceryl/heptaprenylglyceryl phosphate synthase [Flavobacterium magnum]AWA29049.1 geranylgeranylglyceryl/heptaprenylglyceryl phosphate synthase [Flavobacterium magnum]
MGTIYEAILSAKKESRKLLAILLDPDKINWETLGLLSQKINASPASHIFIGGSHVATPRISELVSFFKKACDVPVILFPGNPSQISDRADGILFLSLLSGRNPDFLVGHHVQAAPILAKTGLEILPTGYLLIESGSETAVARVSKTTPMPVSDVETIIHTAMASEMLGHKLLYLEAGSGAASAVPPDIIKEVSGCISIPLIVGGGIRTGQGIEAAFQNGADLVVIGTAFENDIHFFDTKP